MNLLFIADIVGKPGLEIVTNILPGLIEQYGTDVVIANGENAAGGFGITPGAAKTLFENGVDVITSGNHIWDKKTIIPYIKKEPRLLRPLNYPAGAPGSGSLLFRTTGGETIGIINLSGRIFMDPIDCPFAAVKGEIEKMVCETPVIVVDMHAEATSEKISMGWMLDGLVSAVIGTHTHVQTADDKILPCGTAYISDAGMTGPFDSVIGMRKEVMLERFAKQIPIHSGVAEKDLCLNGVLIEIDTESGKARHIKRLQVDYK